MLYQFENHNPRFGACAWLQTADRKGYDISKYQEFVEGCSSQYNLTQHKSKPRLTYKFHGFLNRNIKDFSIQKDTVFNQSQIITETLSFDNSKRRKSHRKRKSYEPGFKFHTIKGGTYSFIVKINGDTLPQTISTFNRRKNNYYSYNRDGNLVKKVVRKKFLLFAVTKEFTGKGIVNKTKTRASIFKHKVKSRGTFMVVKTSRQRISIHRKTKSWDYHGKKRYVKKGKNKRLKWRFRRREKKRIKKLN